MNRLHSDILIVGGGAAGMSAALSASAKSGVSATLVDDNPFLGGQIWRAELGRSKSPDARKLIEAVEAGRIRIINNATVFGQSRENCLLAETPEDTIELEFEKLIIATGARERFLPFPGWTLPNVFGAGGLQALVKGGLCVKDKRIVVAGTGPLLLAVAEYLRSKGATIVAIAEQTSSASLNKFALSLWRSPLKAMQAIRLRAKLTGVTYLMDCRVTSATGKDKVEAINLTRKGKSWAVQCDHLACGFHLVPNIELASILGCKVEKGCVAIDEFQQTSCENVYCAGEPTGIGGVEASLIEGKIAGFAAVGEIEKARESFGEREKSRKFGDMLNRAFALHGDLKSLADDETIVCRCEDVEYGRLREFDSWRTAKLQTRCGMGACQGRICGAATEFLFGWETGAVRPPIFPVKLENL